MRWHAGSKLTALYFTATLLLTPPVAWAQASATPPASDKETSTAEPPLSEAEAAPELAPEPQGPVGAIELLSIYARIKDTRKQALLLDLAESFARDS